MRITLRSLILVVAGHLIAAPTSADVVINSAWFDVTADVSLQNGTTTSNHTDAELRGGLKTSPSVSTGNQSIPFATGSASASASGSVSGSVLSADLATFATSSDLNSGRGFPLIQASSKFLIDFNVTSGPAPLSFATLSNSGTTTLGSPLGPEFEVIGLDGSVVNNPTQLGPGHYLATAELRLADGTYNGNDLTNWLSTVKFDFGPATTYAPGFDQIGPIDPGPPTFIGGQPVFFFNHFQTGSWADPTPSSGYHFQMTDGNLFTDIMDFPSGFSDLFEVDAEGKDLGMFGPGTPLNFTALLGHAVSEFDVLNITPGTDPTDPLAFPIQLGFNVDRASFTMTALGDLPGGTVGEPPALALVSLAVAAMLLSTSRRRSLRLNDENRSSDGG